MAIERLLRASLARGRHRLRVIPVTPARYGPPCLPRPSHPSPHSRVDVSRDRS